MGCGATSKITPGQEPKPQEKQKIVIIVIGKRKSDKMFTECLESLKKECVPHHVKEFSFFNDAFDYIRPLETLFKVILIVVGHSQQEVKDEMSLNVSLQTKIRSLFVYSNENENAEKPTTPITQYVNGKRHLLSAVRDAIDTLDASRIPPHHDHYVSVTIHQSTLNELFEVIKSVQFTYYKVPIKISQMRVFLSPSSFEFVAHAETNARIKLSQRIMDEEVHGECGLRLNKETKKVEITIKKLIVKFPEILGHGGYTDVSGCIPSFPLDGYINYAYPFDLPDYCETKHLQITPEHLEYSTEEQRVTFSVQIHCAEQPK